jgi:hypothetical protein
MAIYENIEHFAGKSVENYDPAIGIADPIGKIYRLRTDYYSKVEITDLISTFLEDPRVSEILGIVIGGWENAFETSSQDIVEALVAARGKLPDLKAIFLGEMTCEECEISWILQSDVSPLLAAYPQLEHFRVRGNEGLSLGALRHEKLQSLVVETGGLNPNVVRQVCQSQLLALEHLELWLGSPEYGGDTTIDDLQPILSGQLFPKLRYLGLRDSEIADDIAIAIANAPILDRIEVLDLSLGTLGDVGAEALLASPAVAKLDKLDLHHHFISEEVVARLVGIGIEVDVSDLQEEEGYGRYVSVSE